jgi:serine/threonine-protein phosphatase 2A regulatory subunit B'
MKTKALQHAPGGKLPEGYVEIPHPPPPPPSAIDDVDIMDLSMELSAASIDDVPGDLDEHGIERVPMADPGLDVSFPNNNLHTVHSNMFHQRPLPEIGGDHHSPTGLHSRRKSVLPGNCLHDAPPK